MNSIHISYSIYLSAIPSTKLTNPFSFFYHSSRIFYSTTTASNEKTRPLQELLEAKKVHLRPDFEPWIPVDIMERDDREAVFRYPSLLPYNIREDQYIDIVFILLYDIYIFLYIIYL